MLEVTDNDDERNTNLVGMRCGYEDDRAFTGDVPSTTGLDFSEETARQKGEHDHEYIVEPRNHVDKGVLVLGSGHCGGDMRRDEASRKEPMRVMMSMG